MSFDEYAFIKGLTERPFDAQRFSQFFEPVWLETASLQPIIKEIFKFVDEKQITPSTKTLRDIFNDKDAELYEKRHKATLDRLDALTDPPDYISHQIDKATEAAKANSIKTLISGSEFAKDLKSLKGSEAAKKFETLLTKFREPDGFREWDIKELVEETNKAKTLTRTRIPCGINIMDAWSNGGLRPKNLGIICTSTGVGKSLLLAVIAYKIAAVEQKRVLHISNELTGEEVGERFLPLLTGRTLNEVMEEKVVDHLGEHWEAGLDQRLRCLEITKEVSTSHIEAILARYQSVYGWSPQVIVLDYMERLKPTAKGYNRDNTSGWFEGVARDLVALNKRRGTITWTAAQINRGGMAAKELGLHHGQGSIKHFQEADMVVTVQKKQLPAGTFNGPDEKDDVAFHFICQKMRGTGAQGQQALVQVNTGRMLLKRNLLDLSLLDEPEEEQETNGLSTKTWKKKKKDQQ